MGIALNVIDAGGGLGIDYPPTASSAVGRYGNAFDAAAKVEEYAAAMERALGDFDGRLLIEPGRFLVAQAGALVARVLYVKRNGKKTFVITDAAMNDLIRPALYQAHHEIVPVRPRAGKPRIVDVVGPICESGDFFARDRKLAPVRPGDLVARARCGRLRHGAKLELQLPPASRRGADRRRQGTADPPPRDHGRSARAGKDLISRVSLGLNGVMI